MDVYFHLIRSVYRNRIRNSHSSSDVLTFDMRLEIFMETHRCRIERGRGNEIRPAFRERINNLSLAICVGPINS